MVYAAIFEDSCEIGFEAAKQSGLRVIPGQDDDGPRLLWPAPTEKKCSQFLLLQSERLCRKWHRAEEGRLEYAFSPRFAVTCSEKLMRSAAELATRFRCLPANSSRGKIARRSKKFITFIWVSARRDYTHVYEQCGLLTPKTMLGHCIHLNPRENRGKSRRRTQALLIARLSNLFLGSGLIKLDQLLKAGIAIGLGSDVAAGPELKHVAGDARGHRCAEGRAEPTKRTCARCARARHFNLANPRRRPCSRQSRTVIGTLDVGKEADLIIVDLTALVPYPQARETLGALSTEDVLRALRLSRRSAREPGDLCAGKMPFYPAPEARLRFHEFESCRSNCHRYSRGHR